MASTSLALIACGSRGEQLAISPTATSAPVAVPSRLEAPELEPAAPVAEGVPHGSDVMHLAVTEQRDAAISVDFANSYRLWPALDGSRPPVLLHLATEAAQLAILHAGRDLVAVVLDRGGALTLLRVGLDGSLRGRMQVGRDDAAFEEVVVTGEHILARTSEHVIEHYTADGTLRGRLVLEPGQRITHLAARNGRVAAVTADRDTSYVRWISLGATLAWQPAITLPMAPRAGMFAIAPTRSRIAFVDEKNTGVHVLDVELVPTPLVGKEKIWMHHAFTSMGFLEDDTVALAGNSIAWWRRDVQVKPAANAPVDDPWATPDEPSLGTLQGSSFPRVSMVTRAAFAKDAVIGASQGALVIATPERTQYLGWRTNATGINAAPDGHLVMSHNGHSFQWLDENLAPTRTVDIGTHRPPGSNWAYGQPAGEHHLLAQAHFGDKSSFYLVDANRPDEPFQILEPTRNVENYFIGEGTLGIRIRKQIRRFKLDLATTTATELKPAIKANDYSMSFLRVFDPARTGGLVAVTVSWPTENSMHQALTYYRLVDGKITKERVARFDGHIFHATADGELYTFERIDTDTRIRVIKNGATVREIVRERLTPPFAVVGDGTRFAMRDDNAIVMFDETGTELWKTPVWSAANVIAAAGGSRLVVNAVGGAVVLDTATGGIVTRECGFDFGLHDDPPAFVAHGFATVCEDPIVQ